MITGSVNEQREAVIDLVVVGPDGRRQRLATVIDTGFSEYLTLRSAVVAALKLHWTGSVRMVLGDGSEEFLDVYAAVIVWDGIERLVPVHATDIEPFIGMSLLAGYELRVQVVPDGAVSVEALP